MALKQAWSDMAANYRFHASIRGNRYLRSQELSYNTYIWPEARPN